MRYISRKSDIASFIKNCNNVELQFYVSAYIDEAYAEWWIYGDPVTDFDQNISDSVMLSCEGKSVLVLSRVFLTKKEELSLIYSGLIKKTMIGFMSRVQEKDRLYRRWVSELTCSSIEEPESIRDEMNFWINLKKFEWKENNEINGNDNKMEKMKNEPD